MNNLNILVVGVGGQGTLLTSRIIGKTALLNDLQVKLSEVHGMAQRGGSVVTFVRFGENICEPVVELGCADVLISFERLEALRYEPYLKKDGIIIVNECSIKPMSVLTGACEYPQNIIEDLKTRHKVYTVNAMEIANEIGNTKVVNTVVLGFSAKHIGFNKEDWLNVISQTVPEKTIELNKNAFMAGYKKSEATL